MPMSHLVGIVRDTMAMTSGLAVSVMEQLAWLILIPRISPVSYPLILLFLSQGTYKLTENKDYKNAVEWIQQQIDSNDQYKSDDTRFWVDIPSI